MIQAAKPDVCSLVNNARIELRRYALAEQTKQVGDEEDHQYRPKSYTCTAAGTPAGMAVVPSTASKNQHQNDDEYEHCRFFSF
jgi:hypothetical protein